MERITHTEGRDLPLMGRPTGNGYVITRGVVSAASIAIYERGNTTAVYTRTLLLDSDPDGSDAQCMFAAETTGAPWPKAGGMTFYYIHPDSLYHLDGGKSYKVVVSLTADNGTAAFPELASYGFTPLEYEVAVRSVAGV